jgi:hypothetical protein
MIRRRFITAGMLISGQQELVEIRSHQAVYFPPWKNLRLARYYSYLEKLENKLPLATGSFLAVVARKRITPPYFSNYPYLCCSTRRLGPACQRSGQAAISSGRPKGSDTCKGKWGNILPGGEDQGGINLLPVTA